MAERAATKFRTQAPAEASAAEDRQTALQAKPKINRLEAGAATAAVVPGVTYYTKTVVLRAHSKAAAAAPILLHRRRMP
jgi:hypothetical protein